MPTLFILYKKELKHFLFTPFGWVVLAFIMLLQGLSLSSVLEQYEKTPVQDNLLFSNFTTFIFWIYFLFLFPLITMKQFAEEERSGTLENLLTAPITTWQVLFSKYLSSYTFYLLLWAPVYLHLYIVSWISEAPLPASQGDIIGTFLILALIGAFFTSIGILASSLTSSQIIAAIITFAALAFHLFLGYIPMIAGDSFQGAIIFHYLAIHEHIAYFSRGLIDLRAITYHLSMAILTLIVTHHIVDYRRWKH